jgi:hypothetical protein
LDGLRLEGQKLKKIRVFRGDNFDFSCKKIEKQCKLDVRVIACNFLVFVIFSFFSDFFCPNSFIFEPKIEKIYMGVFSTHFVPLISILEPKIKID